jgi:asparagine synthase (glutamine-hydrolysing)
MTDVMEHRGPNDRGTYVTDGAALGARRLSIVDVEGGHQPFGNERGDVWAVQNGELYNHVSIRDELRGDGHVFHSRCDTEVLPHLYERDRSRLPERLRGMFGLAVWDSSARTGLLARDRIGIKPLYYAVSADLLVFGSELKAVLASGLIDAELDYDAIDAYLTFGFLPGPRTPLAGVHKLLPGERVVVERGDYRVERYWEYPKPRRTDPPLDLDEAAELLVHNLEESVRLRLMSDVPLGAMLSGGLDSSLIVALMARNMSSPVKTFSVGFREDGELNELADARYVANVLGADHHELELSHTHDAIDLATLVWHLDEPLADLSALGFQALSQLAASHVTVALSGQGADELFGGYTKHRAASIVSSTPFRQPLARAFGKFGQRAPARFKRPLETLAAPDPASRVLAMSSKLRDDMRRMLYRGPLATRDGREGLRVVGAIADGVEDDPLPATLFIDGQLALVDDMLHYFDRSSMAYSLEVRVPFLDHEFVEFAATIPGSLKVRRLQTKHVLKHAARGLVPDRIVDKRKLGFFADSAGEWLRSQLDRALAEYLLAPDARCNAFLDRDALSELVSAHVAGRDRGRNARLLLALLMLEVWLAEYLPRAMPNPRAEHRRRVA